MRTKQQIWRTTALALLMGVAACGGDGDGTGSRAPTAVTATTPTTMTAVAGSAVTPAPAVRVVDSQGRGVSGVAVVFAVTGGGGTVTAGSVQTGSDGTATAGGWTLGTVAGVNTLTATVQGLTAVTFTANGTAGAPTSLAKVSGEPQTGAAGTALAQPLVVRVTDANGNPVAGTTVAFAVTSGGGTVTPTSAVTDAQGRASATLTLGVAAGAQTVTATVAGLPAVTFSVTATAGPAATLTKVAGDNQTARTGTAVPVAPSVRVTDQFGNPVSGVTVTFNVTAGGGSVTGGVVTTSATGTATVGSWTLGATPGTNTLTASAPGVASVNFTATATGDPCSSRAPFTLRTTVAGALSTTDCRLQDGSYIDLYSTGFPAAQAEEFVVTSTAIDAFAYLFDAAGNVVAIDDDDEATSSSNSVMRVFAPAGQYTVGVSSYNPGEVGAYQLTSRAMTTVTGCDDRGWIVPGVTVSGTLTSTDCRDTDNTLIEYYPIVLRPGQQVTITMQSSAFDTYLFLYNSDGTTVASNDDFSGTNSRIVYTATVTDVFYIGANALLTSGTGAYTLTVTRP
jgi:hypothetical protein